MTFLFALVVVGLLFLGSVTVVLLMIGPTLLLRPRRRTAEYYRHLGLPVSPADLSLPSESFMVASDDGITLNGWLIRAEAPVRGTILYLHGVGDCMIDGLRLAKLLHDHRYNVVLYDARRHGTSDGKFCTYGYYEKHDAKRILDFFEAPGGLAPVPVGVFGTSMGAAVALQAAAIDKRIRAVIAENSFATLRSIFDDYQKRMIKLPLHFLRNIVIVRSEFLADFKASEVSPLDAVSMVQVPILFIYGEDDLLINCKYSIQLYKAANEPKQVYAIKGASHNNTRIVGGKEYEERVLKFFEENLVK